MDSILVLQVPDGYTARSARMDDAEAVCRLWIQQDAEVGIVSQHDPELMRVEWSMPTHNFALDSHVIEAPNGEVVASVNLWSFSNPPVRLWLSWVVDVAHRHQGLEDAIFAWGVARAEQRLVDCPEGTKMVLHSNSWLGHAYREQIFKKADWQIVRHFNKMRVVLDAEPVVPPLPQGFSIRPIRYPDEVHEAVQVDMEAFRDHWGFSDQPLDEAVIELRHEWDNDRRFDPSLFFVIVDEVKNQFAATIWNFEEMGDDPHSAYVDNVAVLRDYRGLGIGLSMLCYSFRELYRRGRKSIVLYVDADSLTGALRLYEKAGMHRENTSVRYEWVIREGKDLMTRALAE